ncbi:MAG: UDP-glucose dehydrogenase family protein [Actinomycetota bacterium]
MERANVTVVGSGYVGTVVAASFASLGRSVIGVEVDDRKLATLKSGRAPFYEAGLDDLLAEQLGSGRLTFTNDVRFALAGSDIVFLCVGTPGVANGRADMSAMAAAARAIGGALQRDQVLVTKSTVPIGSGNWLEHLVTEALRERGEDRRFAVVSNPEFLREGSAIDDFLHPERVVLGSDNAAAIDAVADLYKPILEQSFPGGDAKARPPLIRTNLVTAEAVKYAANAFLATKVSFINEVANICDLVGADVSQLSNAIGLDSRIGDRFLDAGAGWGGSCFGKDVDELIAEAEEHGYDPHLLKATVAVNRQQREIIIKKLQRHLGTLRGRRIGILGLAFKPGTDDLRDAPAVDISARLLEMGAFVIAHDPVVERVPDLPALKIAGTPYEAADGVDAVVLLTEWPEFLAIDIQKLVEKMRGNVFIDARNVFEASTMTAAGLVHEGIGRPAATAGMPISS